jgi:hypothetical protein
MLEALDESASGGAKFASLHNAYSATGTGTEIAGGTPAYARVGVTWNAAGSGVKTIAGQLVFQVPPLAQVRFVGFWDALTGGTFLGMSPNGGGIPQAFVVPNIANDTLECAAHGFNSGDMVVVWLVPGDTLPGGLAEGGVYYVSATGFTTEHLQLSATSGGASIDIASIGAGYLQKIVSETFGGQGTHTVTSVTMTMD